MKDKPKKKMFSRQDRPISLHPLTPEQALKAFMKTPVKAQKKATKKSHEKKERE